MLELDWCFLGESSGETEHSTHSGEMRGLMLVRGRLDVGEEMEFA